MKNAITERGEKMNMYHVKVTETLTMTVEVEAENELSAEQQVSDDWRNCEYILDAANFTGVTFEVVRNEENTAESGFSLKQLYDYIANWRGLMQENAHLRENERIINERKKVLTDVCACIVQLEKATTEIAELQTKIHKPS